MKVSNKAEAWKLAAILFSQDYELNKKCSDNAGYPIYTPVVQTENNLFDQIADLNTGLEVIVNGETFRINIEEYNTYELKTMRVNIQFLSGATQNVCFENAVNITTNQNKVVIVYLNENKKLDYNSYLMSDIILSIIPA